MARLPTVEAFGPSPTPRSQRGVVPIRAGVAQSAAAAGFRQAAASAAEIGNIADAFIEGQQRQKLAKARSDFLIGKVELDAEFAQDQDFETAEERYAEALENLRGAASGGLSGASLNEFDNQTKVDIARGTATRKADVFTKRRDHNLAELAGTLDTNREGLLRAQDPETRQSLLDASNLSILSMVEQGFLSKVEAQKLGQEIAVDFATSRVSMQPPEEQLRLLDVPRGWAPGDALPARKKNGSVVDMVPADDRVDLARKAHKAIETAERQRLRDLATIDKAAEKELKEARDFRAAELTDGILEGTVTDADLDDARDNREIDGKQFIAARKLLKAQESDDALEDDPAVVLAFTRQVEDGTLTTGEVYQAYADKLIKRERMDAFLSDISSNPDDSHTREQKQRLKENVGGSSGGLAVFDEDTTRKVNRAVDEFERRTRGPNKEDPMKVRKDLEEFYGAGLSLDDLPDSRFMRSSGDGGADKDTMDMRQSRKSVGRALAQGKITPAQATREVQLLKDIEAARGRQ